MVLKGTGHLVSHLVSHLDLHLVSHLDPHFPLKGTHLSSQHGEVVSQGLTDSQGLQGLTDSQGLQGFSTLQGLQVFLLLVSDLINLLLALLRGYFLFPIRSTG
jgi:hypothetical protein